jgi:hypothetical protein
MVNNARKLIQTFVLAEEAPALKLSLWEEKDDGGQPQYILTVFSCEKSGATTCDLKEGFEIAGISDPDFLAKFLRVWEAERGSDASTSKEAGMK